MLTACNYYQLYYKNPLGIFKNVSHVQNEIRLHLKYLRAIYKTMNTGAGNGMRAMRGTRGMVIRIPGNLSEDSGKCCYVNIPGNVEEYSVEYSKRFLGMLVKIPGNAQEDSGEY